MMHCVIFTDDIIIFIDYFQWKRPMTPYYEQNVTSGLCHPLYLLKIIFNKKKVDYFYLLLIY